MKLRVGKGLKISGAMKKLSDVRSVSLSVNRELCARVMAPTLTLAAKTWRVKKKERHKLDVLEIMCLLSVCGVTSMVRDRN